MPRQTRATGPRVRPGQRERDRASSSVSTSSPSPAPSPERRIAPAPKRTRLRATRVCGRCKRLKLRCDLGRPCATCSRAGLPDGCAYARLGGLEARDVVAKNGVPEGLALSPFPTPVSLASPRPTGGPPLTDAGLPGPAGDAAGELAALAALLPPPETVRALRAAFATFDLLFRMVPAAWFARRSDALLDRLPHVGREDAPLLALIAAVMLVGANVSASDEETHAHASPAHLRQLTDALTRHCTTYGPHNVDYAHAHVVANAAELTGPESSPVRAWVAIGTSRAALLLARVHVDAQGETLWEREVRRRVWHLHMIAHCFVASRLDLPHDSAPLPVPRPLVLSDTLLEQESSSSSCDPISASEDVAEWAYVDAKIGWAELLSAQTTLLASSAPLHARLARAHTLIDDYWASLPAYLRDPPSPSMPPWAHAQALVMRIGKEEALVQLYRPFFGLSGSSSSASTANEDERVALVAAGIDPLARGLVAAHSLCTAVQELSVHLLFRWLDSGDCALWIFGTRAFTAGMVMAYAELAGRGSVHEVDALDAAVGSLRLSAGKLGSSRTNAAALAVLEGVRRVARAHRSERTRRVYRHTGRVRVERIGGHEVGDTEEEPDAVTDPYTGQSIALPTEPASPPTPPSLSWFPVCAPQPDSLSGIDASGSGSGSGLPLWDEWEVLFRDFLQPENVGLAGAGTT